jgi:hypothetical protein
MLILNFTVAPLGDQFVPFLVGLVLLVAGEVLFLVGVDNSIITMGTDIGENLTKFKKIAIILAFGFVFGFLCTIAEPDVQVRGVQVDTYAGINPWLLICVIGVGVGIFVSVSMLRTFTGIKLKYFLLVLYIVVFILAAVLQVRNPQFVPIAFDSGGVTTGPITVPFILALGIGIAAVRGGSKSEDSFGMVALASIGPIIAMMVFGLIFPVGNPDTAADALTPMQLLWETVQDVAIGLSPIVVIFVAFQFLFIKLPWRKLVKILLGALICFVGLTLFLYGVNLGFMEAAKIVGEKLAKSNVWWLLIPIGLGIGFVTVYTEPAIIVLGGQVQEITGGQITKKTLVGVLAVAVGIAIMLAVIKVLFALSIWWFLLPGYGLALILMFFSPDIFTAIGVDSGGVASGPMTATFSLPLMMGICNVVAPGETLMFAFGVVALVAMMPLIVIQLLGVVYKRKANAAVRLAFEREQAAIRAIVAEEREKDKDLSGLD